jgi:hypothetical protein
MIANRKEGCGRVPILCERDQKMTREGGKLDADCAQLRHSTSVMIGGTLLSMLFHYLVL